MKKLFQLILLLSAFGAEATNCQHCFFLREGERPGPVAGVPVSRTRGLWEELAYDRTDYHIIGVEDLGSDRAFCRMCGKDDVRYVHTMVHARNEEHLHVGCCCASTMMGVDARAEQAIIRGWQHPTETRRLSSWSFGKLGLRVTRKDKVYTFYSIDQEAVERDIFATPPRPFSMYQPFYFTPQHIIEQTIGKPRFSTFSCSEGRGTAIGGELKSIPEALKHLLERSH